MRVKFTIEYESGRTETKFAKSAAEAKKIEADLKRLSTVRSYQKAEVKR